MQRALELLTYLPGSPEDELRRYQIDQEYQGSLHREHNVRLDLKVLNYNPVFTNLMIPDATGTREDDLVAAFCNRYGEHPETFRGDFPEEIAQIANMKAGLLHDKFWKLDDLAVEIAHEHIMRREELEDWCTMAIRATCRWPNQEQQGQAILTDLRKEQDRNMDLIRIARTSQALGGLDLDQLGS